MSQPQHPIASNPFALLMDPEPIFRAIEHSERLARLQSRVCRPLDKPLLPVVAAEEADTEGGSEVSSFGGCSIDELDLPGEEI
jgi:hypothetical protein